MGRIYRRRSADRLKLPEDRHLEIPGFVVQTGDGKEPSLIEGVGELLGYCHIKNS